MPKNEKDEANCINHPEEKLEKQKEVAVMQAYERDESGVHIPKQTGYAFDVYICEKCDYTELYAKNKIDE